MKLITVFSSRSLLSPHSAQRCTPDRHTATTVRAFCLIVTSPTYVARRRPPVAPCTIAGTWPRNRGIPLLVVASTLKRGLSETSTGVLWFVVVRLCFSLHSALRLSCRLAILTRHFDTGAYMPWWPNSYALSIFFFLQFFTIYAASQTQKHNTHYGLYVNTSHQTMTRCLYLDSTRTGRA